MFRFSILCSLAIVVLSLVSCAGSPARSIGMSADEYARANFRRLSLEQLCGQLTWKKAPPACQTTGDRYGTWKKFCAKFAEAGRIELRRRGKPIDYCTNPTTGDRPTVENPKATASEDAEVKTETETVFERPPEP